MTTDKTPATLATVKHGGCVQLGDGLLPLPRTYYNACGDGSEPLYTAEQMRDYARAALAAQPFPGGQGEGLRYLTQRELDSIGSQAEGMDGEQWDRWVQAKFAEVNGLATVDSDGFTTLAARQPVGEPVAHEYTFAGLGKRDSVAFIGPEYKPAAPKGMQLVAVRPLYAAPPAQIVPFDTVLRVVKALVNCGEAVPESQEEQSARAIQLIHRLCKHVPAQAVDLGPLRSLARSWIVEAGGTVADTKHACADELLALIDSQDSSHG
jgi:hypothetical protein